MILFQRIFLDCADPSSLNFTTFQFLYDQTGRDFRAHNFDSIMVATVTVIGLGRQLWLRKLY